MGGQDLTNVTKSQWYGAFLGPSERIVHRLIHSSGEQNGFLLPALTVSGRFRAFLRRVAKAHIH